MLVRMWEARAEPGRLAELLAWLQEFVVPTALAAGASSYELASAAEPDPRAVLITRWASDEGWAEPTAPAGLVARAHAWPFERVAP